MKVVILAGGQGTRLSEETTNIPKPMVLIGGKPILWHIMKIYSHYGFNEFILCLGYRGFMIKEYFSHYFLHMSDITIDLKDNQTTIHNSFSEPWKITLVDTGMDTMTGGRIKRIKEHLNNEPFMLTYGDGVADIDIRKLLQFHQKHGKTFTMSAVQPTGRFGTLKIDKQQRIQSFKEKLPGDNHWINGGFFVIEPAIFKLLSTDQTILEKEPLEKLAKSKEMFAYQHRGFWYPMDTLRDKVYLESLWKDDVAPWKVWKK